MPFERRPDPAATSRPESTAASAYQRFLEDLDPPVKAVAAAFSELPAGRGRQMRETALFVGIDAASRLRRASRVAQGGIVPVDGIGVALLTLDRWQASWRVGFAEAT